MAINRISTQSLNPLIAEVGFHLVSEDSQPIVNFVYLVEITAAIDSVGKTQVFRFASGDFTTGPAEIPANTYYEPRVKTPADISRQLFSTGTTYGASRIGYGVIELSNIDGGLDYLLDYSFDGRSLVVKVGDMLSRYSSFETVINGTMEQVEANFNTVTILVRDKLATLDTPIQKNEYLGNNALPEGVEGTADIKGRKKPMLFGQVYNIPPTYVNTSKLIYQFADDLADVNAVYDRGVALTRYTPDYTDVAAMLATAPPSSDYQVCKTITGSYIRLRATPAGQITCDAYNGTAATRTVAQIITAIALRAGVPASEIYASDIATLDAYNSAEVGIWIDGEETAIALLDTIAGSIGAWYGYDLAGMLRFGLFQLPSGDVATDITADNLLDIEIIRPSDTDKGLPATKVTLAYAKNYTVQNTDLAGGVSQSRRNFLNVANRYVSVNDNAILSKYLLAPEIVRESALISETAALAEANRVLTMYKTKRTMFNVRIALDQDEVFPELNSIAKLTLPRFGLDNGRLFRIIGISSNYAVNRATLTLWG